MNGCVSGPVFCCAIDPKNGNLAITGGEDDQAYVWEIQNGEIIMECKGHNVSFMKLKIIQSIIVTISSSVKL